MNNNNSMDTYGHENKAAATLGGADIEDFAGDSKPGRTINFAEKMHLVLSNKDCQDAVAWLPSGRSFCITNKDKFVSVILPKFFKSRANFNSFERRLKTWGFSKIDASSKVYVFTHESFDRTTRSPQEMQEEGARFNVMKQIRILLDDPEFQSFIWWLPDGKSFCVSSTSELASKILFQYFGETQFKSFVTTMKKEGFERVKTSDHFGEAVYSHELFRMGRPDLCGRMCRGGTADHLGLNQVPGTVVANSLTDQYLMPNSLGNNPYAMAPTAASNVSSMQSLQGAMNPTMMAQRTNGMNYPMPMNGVMSAQFPGAAAGMGMAHMLNQPSNPFAFNRMSSTDMQKLAQANHHRESLLQKQNQLIQSGMGAEQAAAANQQQIMASIMNRRNSGQAGMTPTEQLQQQHNIMKSEGNEATFNRRNTAPAAALPQGASASSNSANDITKMSILEIEDELLRVKELKLMMMKRKLEAQLEANEKE